MNLCKYCLGEATTQFKNGAWCCADNVGKCPAIKNKLSTLKSNGFVPWNKGTKGKMRTWNKGKTYLELLGKNKADEYCKKISMSNKGKSKGISKNPEIEKIRRQKISESIKKRYEQGWMPKAGRCKKIHYSSPYAGEVVVDGGWELIVAKFLDECEIRWQRNTKRFPYIHLNGKSAHYTPDFYIPEFGLYLEIKGYETDLDRCKWSQFTEDLVVWKKPQIRLIEKKEVKRIGLRSMFAKHVSP